MSSIADLEHILEEIVLPFISRTKTGSVAVQSSLLAIEKRLSALERSLEDVRSETKTDCTSKSSASSKTSRLMAMFHDSATADAVSLPPPSHPLTSKACSTVPAKTLGMPCSTTDPTVQQAWRAFGSDSWWKDTCKEFAAAGGGTGAKFMDFALKHRSCSAEALALYDKLDTEVVVTDPAGTYLMRRSAFNKRGRDCYSNFEKGLKLSERKRETPETPNVAQNIEPDNPPSKKANKESVSWETLSVSKDADEEVWGSVALFYIGHPKQLHSDFVFGASKKYASIASSLEHALKASCALRLLITACRMPDTCEQYIQFIPAVRDALKSDNFPVDAVLCNGDFRRLLAAFLGVHGVWNVHLSNVLPSILHVSLAIIVEHLMRHISGGLSVLPADLRSLLAKYLAGNDKLQAAISHPSQWEKILQKLRELLKESAARVYGSSRKRLDAANNNILFTLGIRLFLDDLGNALVNQEYRHTLSTEAAALTKVLFVDHASASLGEAWGLRPEECSGSNSILCAAIPLLTVATLCAHTSWSKLRPLLDKINMLRENHGMPGVTTSELSSAANCLSCFFSMTFQFRLVQEPGCIVALGGLPNIRSVVYANSTHVHSEEGLRMLKC